MEKNQRYLDIKKSEDKHKKDVSDYKELAKKRWEQQQRMKSDGKKPSKKKYKPKPKRSTSGGSSGGGIGGFFNSLLGISNCSKDNEKNVDPVGYSGKPRIRTVNNNNYQNQKVKAGYSANPRIKTISDFPAEKPKSKSG